MTVAAPAPAAAAPAGAPSGRRVVVTVVAIQLAACLGFFSVMAHLVAHLRHDLGLLAGTVGLVLGVRVGLQFALLLPVGAVTDAIGARRTGAIACAVRAAGFALLGAADGVGALLCAAVVLAVGGALYNPAAQSLLAGVDPARRSGGFAAYVATQHIATVAGPPLGLALVTIGPGFGALAGTAASLWAIAGGLFLLLPRSGGRPEPARFGAIAAGARAALGDRSFLLFALMTAPTTLLANHIMTAVPLLGFTSGAATLCFCVLAAVAAALQPLVAAGRRGERPWVLRLGLLCAAAAFCVLAPLDGTQTGPLMLAAVLNGVANGLIQPAIFRRAARHAPSGRFGSYYGVLAFCAGMFAFAGDLVIGRLFDLGPAGAAGALLGVGAFALAAAIGTRGP
ncbi:Major Facilitator Superfamily protein [Actinomadura madurae]|uniref:Major Facilitator Superfamily protein n=1 Tax=Actinomadura madurae TaxID=1993 RepID=A0A1I5UV42_9ACTN|nr:MFS transporter [Actinomadura madurae]SFP99131.1 Major Facilitator Superfamily protein [Actinomadura madurae]